MAWPARERGNLEAAFWLLSEEHERRPNDADVTVAYWNVAVALDRVEMAAPAGVELVKRHAAAGATDIRRRPDVPLRSRSSLPISTRPSAHGCVPS